MTRFTLKRNLTIINVEAELHSVPYPLPDSSSVLQNNTERFTRYSSQISERPTSNSSISRILASVLLAILPN